MSMTLHARTWSARCAICDASIDISAASGCIGGCCGAWRRAATSTDLLDSLRDYGNLLPVGVDFKIDHLLYLRDGSRARRVVADARHLPFRNGGADIVTSAHFFHHFTPEENAAILGEAIRVARRGVIVNDTRRHYVPLAVVRTMAAFRMVGRITRSDAPGSIRRGYTLAEARAIATRVRASRVEVVRAWPFRFGLLLWK